MFLSIPESMIFWMRMCVWQLFVCANDICFVLYVRSEMTVLSNNHFPMSGQKTTSKASLHTHGSHHGSLMGSTGSPSWELSWKSNRKSTMDRMTATALPAKCIDVDTTPERNSASIGKAPTWSFPGPLPEAGGNIQNKQNEEKVYWIADKQT